MKIILRHGAAPLDVHGNDLRTAPMKIIESATARRGVSRQVRLCDTPGNERTEEEADREDAPNFPAVLVCVGSVQQDGGPWEAPTVTTHGDLVALSRRDWDRVTEAVKACFARYAEEYGSP
jgi:hypothetical protein